MNLDQLVLEFTATCYNGWPKLKFYIDDDLYEDFTFTESKATVKLPLSLVDGEHELVVELYNKTTSNTLVDDNGNIIQDQLVTLDNLYFDNVQLPNFVKYSGIYYFNDQKIPQGLTWGVNGNWKLNFATPLVGWVLEKKDEFDNARPAGLLTPLEYSSLKKKKLMFYLKQIEKILIDE